MLSMGLQQQCLCCAQYAPPSLVLLMLAGKSSLGNLLVQLDTHLGSLWMDRPGGEAQGRGREVPQRGVQAG